MKFFCGHCSSVLHSTEDHRAEMACPSCASSLRIPNEPGATAEVVRPNHFGNGGTRTIGPNTGHHNLTLSIQAGSGFPASLPGIFEISGETKYDVGEEVARGGMGTILSVRDQNLKRHVAMKVMRYPETVSEDQLARFIEEAQITGQLEHPGIVPVHELGMDAQNRPYYTMKLLRGQTLFAVFEGLRRGDPEAVERWPLHRLITIFKKICEAIRYAHSKRVLHRDLKPANIMIGEFGEVQVLDWGLSKVLGSATEDCAATAAPSDAQSESMKRIESARTESARFQSMDGNISGTLQYMAPEQALGKTHETDERTDIYGLGAILYEMLSLRPPVDDGDFRVVLKRMEEGTIKALSRLPSPGLPHCPGGRIPRPLAAIAMKALARSPEARYANCATLISDIEQYQLGYATCAEQASPWRRAILFLRRRKVFHVAGFLLLGAILSGIGVGWTERGNALRSEQAARTALEQLEAANAETKAARLEAAPALLAAALGLENQAKFAEASLMAKQAVEADPELTEAHLLLAFLDAHAGKREGAEVSLNLSGSGSVRDDLRRLLAQELTDNRTRYAHRLGNLAERADFVGLSTELSAESFQGLKEQYADRIPGWKRKLDKAWPGAGKHLLLISGRGLQFRPNAAVKKHMKDLEALRDIPLQALYLADAPQITSLEPLRGMPLRSLHLQHLGITDLSPLEDLPLTHLYLGAAGSFTDVSALGNRRLDRLYINPQGADLSPLKTTECRNLRLIGQVASLSFLDEMKGLEVLKLGGTTLDSDYTPVLRLHALQEFIGEAYLAQALEPVADALLVAGPEGGEAEALNHLRALRREINVPTQFQFTRSLDILEMLILRKQGKRAPPLDPPALRIGDRYVAALPYRLPQVTPVMFCRTLNVDLARIDNAEEEQILINRFLDESEFLRAMIGLRRHVVEGWRWMGGHKADYTNFMVGQELVEDGKCVNLGKDGWSLNQPSRINVLLIQWDAVDSDE